MKIRIIIVWALLCGVLLTSPHMAQAATWTVNSLDDSSDGACNATNCTLREAITAANAAPDADVIDFASGVTGTLMLGSALPALNTDISIQGPGAEVLAISGTETPDSYTFLRIFNVTGGTVVVSGLTIKKGYISGSRGGGLWNSATLTIRQCVLANNKSSIDGGGVFNSGTLTIENSVLSDNFAAQGGAIYNTGTLTVSDCSLINNSAGRGGGIANILNVSGNIVRGFATVNRCVLSGNAAVTTDNQGYSYSGQGGGLYTDGKLTVNASTIKGNSAAHGGGVYSYHSMLNLFDSTLNNNSAFAGGGVFCINDHPLYSSILWITTMRNCTLSGNAASNGSGFYNFKGLSIIESCTIANSTTLNNGSGGGLVSEISQNRPTETRVRNSLIWGNFGDDVKGTGFVSQGYNIVCFGNAVTSFNQPGDQVTGYGQIKPLADNGGPTQTHALLPNSTAFNAGDPAFSSPPDFDQRGAGFPRVRGGRIDIGAFEAAASLLMSNVEVTESSQGATATFSVSLASPSDQSITVSYSTYNTAGDDANALSDYDATTGTLVFAPGETSKTFSVRVNDDTQDEINERFHVQVNAPDNPEIGMGQATCTILDNDAAPSLSINDTTVIEGSNSFVDVEFTVSLSAASGQMVSVNVVSSDGAARSPDDYRGGGGARLTFVPGETTQTFRVTVVGDLLYEADESFYALLSSPVNASISRERGVAIIQDDDADTTAPTVSFTTSATTPVGTTPVNGSTISGGMPTITGVAADSESGVAKVELRLHRVVNSSTQFWSGTAWGTTQVKLAATLNPTGGGANVSWSKGAGWPTGGNLTDGTYYLTAYATDKANKVASASSNFKLFNDTTAPAVSFTTASTTPVGTTPVSGSTIYNAMPAITGVAADSGSGVAKVELRLHRVVNSVVEFWDGTAWGTTQVKLAATLSPTTGGATVSWSKSDGWPTGGNLTDNTYYLTAYAYDKVGKVASASSSFKKATNTSGNTSGSEMLPASDVKFSAGEAWVSNQSIRLSFSAALEQVTAENRANYHVSICTPVSISQAVTVKSALYDKATRTITLLLAEGSLAAGDTVSVKWSLRDASGAPLTGQAELQAK